MADLIEYTKQNRIGYIILNRPDKRNALSSELVSALKETLLQAEEDETVKVIVIKARGEAFCAGADLAYLQQMQNFSYEENLADSDNLKELFLRIYTLKKVVIAQVQGHALAGGCGLASVCDFSFAVPEAKFAYTEVKIGFVPAIVMTFVLRKIGEGHAKRLLLGGDMISATEAQQIGLINTVVPAEALAETVDAFAQRLIVTNSANSMEMTKQMIATVQSLPLPEALTFASNMNAKARAHNDCIRGVNAFLNKEKITW